MQLLPHHRIVKRQSMLYPTVDNFVRHGYLKTLGITLSTTPDTFLVTVNPEQKVSGCIGYISAPTSELYTNEHTLGCISKIADPDSCCEQATMYATSAGASVRLISQLVGYAAFQLKTHVIFACLPAVARLVSRSNAIQDVCAVKVDALTAKTRQTYKPWLDQAPRVYMVQTKPMDIGQKEVLAA